MLLKTMPVTYPLKKATVPTASKIAQWLLISGILFNLKLRESLGNLVNSPPTHTNMTQLLRRFNRGFLLA